MSQFIPNENTWLGFVVATTLKPFGVGNTSSPTAAEVTGAVDFTDFLVTLNASTSGNTVPVPRIKTKFETTIDGTVTATFTADFYRDDLNDLAWDTFVRGKKGTFLLKRFGGTAAGGKPAVGQKVESWPISVVSRAASPLASGQAQAFTLTASCPKEADEDAVVVA